MVDRKNIHFFVSRRIIQVDRSNQVWAADITGFIYLVAIMDWFSRYVLAWAVSVTVDVDLCLEALGHATGIGKPEIFNTDQASQFTSRTFTRVLEAESMMINMDGRGRVYDNIFVERLWRSVKYEEVYPKEYDSVREAVRCFTAYFRFYNQDRPHQSLGYRTPFDVYAPKNSPSTEPGNILSRTRSTFPP